MDGKTRGGKRLAKRKRKDLDPAAFAAKWTAIIMAAVLVCVFVSIKLAGVGRTEEAHQGGVQGGGGNQVKSWTPGASLALCVPSERPEGVLKIPDELEAPPPVELPTWTEDDLVLLAQTVFAEADICRTVKEKAAVVWCVLNRLDDGGYGDTIREVVTAPHQFAWTEDRPVMPEYIVLAEDVLLRWRAEKAGEEGMGRVLPAEYLFFEGDGWANHFRVAYLDTGAEWDWSLPDPYGDE